ncbi:MAG: choice-of-anchor Q domain-containing protein [Spirosomataceae bacterium]
MIHFTRLTQSLLLLKRGLPLLLFLGMAGLGQAQTIRYVKPNGTGDGLSWDNASGDLQAMINASGTQQVWVAKGTYKPANSNRNISFRMKAGVKIYGSFAGTETNLSERTPAVMAANQSILSGDLNNDDATTGNDENSYHVVFNINNGLTTDNSLLDGFSIRGGNANSDVNPLNVYGGGMYNLDSSPSIKNCIFSGNQAVSYGGGMYNHSNSSPSLVNCSFLGNMAVIYGGGIANHSNSSPNLVNCSFSGNQAKSYGGGVHNFESSPSLVNCSFSGNQADDGGGGMTNLSNSSSNLKNCILWGNSSEVFNNGSNPTYINTLVKSLAVGNFFGTEDPLFVNQPSIGLGTGGNLRLLPCSPAVNAGNNAYNSADTDLDGKLRIFGGTVDMGAYEYQGNAVSGTRIHVNASSAAADGDGSSWATAYTDLQTALANARLCSQITEIWVAKGIYKPGTNRSASFSMVPGVKIYGSFAGTETDLSQRTSAVMAANKSILSGDLNGDDVITGSGSTLNITGNDENSYHIFNNNNNGLTVSNSLLDGFTISGANSSGSTPSTDIHGGGMYNLRASPSISNVTFTGNDVLFDGGGMYNSDSSPSLTNVIFVRNRSKASGGAIANHGASPSLSNVTFEGNKAKFGGGIANYGNSSPILINVTFSGNNAGNGGGIFLFHNSAPILINVIFSGNTADNGGGIYNASAGTVTIKNSLFWGNTANNGGGISNSSTGSVTIKNSLFWGNTASVSGPEIIYLFDSSTNTDISYSLLQLGSGNYSTGFSLGAGMLYGQNPLFVNTADPDGADNVFGTADDGLQLLPCSPVINVGDNAAVSSTDITGSPRIIGGTVDMGAYEYQGNAVSGTRIHVNASSAAADGDGSSWATAYTDLQTALANARICTQITEIWVAKGIYKPGTNRSASFSMVPGVKLYGSFAGTETDLSQRTSAVMAANQSTLSGDLNGDDVTAGNGENSYHVIGNSNNGLTTTNSLLDGFTITGGNANGGESNSNGGGMHNEDSSPSLVNCSFLGNRAERGGGMGNIRSSPNLVNCSFSGNQADNGGGMNNYFSSSPSLVNCTFSGNQATGGGGMYNYNNSSPSLKNCILWGNSSEVSNIENATPNYINTIVKGLVLEGFQGNENPLFVNQPPMGFGIAGDLRLRPCSPAINAGSDADNINNTDLDGNPRKVGTIDLGAYEYQSTPPAAITPAVSVSHPTTCGGSEGSISMSGFLNNTVYNVSYKKNDIAVAAADFTSTGNGVITLTGLGAGSYTDIVGTYGACVSTAATATLTDPTKPGLTLGTIPAICAGAMSFTIPFTNPTQSPDRYSISGSGITGVTEQILPGSPITVNLSSAASGSSIPFTLTVKNTATNCVSDNIMGSVTVKPVPMSSLSASQTDVCPNTQVTLNPNCTVPGSTVKWNPGAPTVIPDAATASYVYKASCTLEGCTGNESSVEVRTHRILADLKNVGSGPQPKALAGSVLDNLAPTNTITAPPSPRLWTVVATGCAASESAVFKLSGPVSFSSIDNGAPYALFANAGSDFFAIDHPNYGTGGGFSDGVYILSLELRSQDGIGGPFPKNRVATGTLLATRTLQFTVGGTGATRQESDRRTGIGQEAKGQEGTEFLSDNEQRITDNGAFALIAPNPVMHTLHLSVKEAKGQQVKVRLTDAAGRDLLQRYFIPATDIHQEEFEVSALGVGMYFLKVQTTEKQITLKVVKAE